MIRHSSKTDIFSLTEGGARLATTLKQVMPGAAHHHGGESFAKNARETFSQGHDCIFICSTGIVIRTLASILGDKHSDPAVIVLDEQGKFVIPLLSGHEGGAGALAREIADAISAHCVVTSATDYGHPVYTAGLGCEKNCPLESLQTILDSALDTLPRPVDISAFASIDIKNGEPGLLDLTRKYELELQTFPSSALREVEHLLSEKSEIVFREVGCYGVAEAAALCAASGITGEPAELVVSKIKGQGATIAIARSYLQ